MADNVQITAGSGTTILTDDCTTGHAQIFKQAISTDGSATLIPADATNGLLVDVKRVQGVVAIGDGTDTVSVATAGADGESNTVNRLETENYGMVFNGTTWDRARGNLVGAIAQSPAITVYGGGTQTGTADQAVMAAAASNYNYLCYVTIFNSSSTNTYAIIKDNTTVVAHVPLPAYGGAIFQPPHPLKSAATNTAWNVAAAAGVTTASFYGGGFRSTV
jgi:hypothetical protein